MKLIDNVVILPLVEGLTLDKLGILDSESTVTFTFDELTNDKGTVFLPAVLKQAGLFSSTSEIKKINDQRMKTQTDPDQNLWRSLNKPEMTMFKIGKRVFWLIVGERQ